MPTDERPWGSSETVRDDNATGYDRRLTRSQLVTAIMERNLSASTAYLDNFEDDELEEYLGRLVWLDTPRGRNARWPRSGTTPGIVTERRAA